MSGGFGAHFFNTSDLDLPPLDLQLRGQFSLQSVGTLKLLWKNHALPDNAVLGNLVRDAEALYVCSAAVSMHHHALIFSVLAISHVCILPGQCVGWADFQVHTW